MYIAILGRQPALGMAELEHLYGGDNTQWFSDQSALVQTESFPLETLGGTQKAGRVVAEFARSDWRHVSMKVVQAYTAAWTEADAKMTLGISAYGFDACPRDVQKTGIILKQKLKKQGVSLRLIPNTEPYLNTATAHHNKLGLSNNKVELILVRNRGGKVILAESIGSQNITALARRDQERPKRDAFVGMLPPKLAQIMINLAQTHEGKAESVKVLDPFCGTGVILQEAALMGYAVYGTDLSDKMIDYSRTNLEWLASSHHLPIRATIEQGDATNTKWPSPIDAVVCETYLGQPFSAPPSPAKLAEVKKTCEYIITTFLQNLAPQIASGTALCLAIPAWRDTNGQFAHLSLIRRLNELGYTEYAFRHVRPDDLLYYRPDQVVARQLLALIKA